MALRRQWAHMNGRQQSTVDAPPTNKDIQLQRLTKVLVPVLHPATRDWTFNTRVTGLNLANASVGSSIHSPHRGVTASTRRLFQRRLSQTNV